MGKLKPCRNLFKLSIFIVAATLLISCAEKACEAGSFPAGTEIAAENFTAPPVETETPTATPVETRGPRNRDDFFFSRQFPTDDQPVYKYTMAKGRNWNWEHDIVYFMFILQRNHPLFLESEEKTQELQDKVYSLIARIPELEDNEIAYGLAEITAWIGDVHTALDYFTIDDEVFPFSFKWFSEDGIYATTASPDFSEAFLCRLVGINGYDIEEIIQRIADVLPSENVYWLKNRSSGWLRYRAMLKYISIIDNEEKVDFTFVDNEGKTFIVNAESVKYSNYGGSANEINIIHKPDPSVYYIYSHGDDYYWSEYFPDDKMMYAYHWRCEEMENQSQIEFYNEILRRAVTFGAEKLVIDLRNNTGGWLDHIEFENFAKSLSESYSGQIYILISDVTYSNGIYIASQIMRYNENTVLVGSPTRGAVNFYASFQSDLLPNSKIKFIYSTAFWENIPGYKANTLMPDIYIPLTFEDYINNYDKVLETVRSY